MSEIYIIENVFTEEERRKILEDSQRFFVDGDVMSIERFGEPGRYPGKQTYPTIHLLSSFNWVHKRVIERVNNEIKLNLKIVRSWFNWSDGRKEYLNWHEHKETGDYAAVYYLKTIPFFNSGTLFKEYGFVRAPQNSIMIFPSHFIHSAPISFLRYDRYSMAFDLRFEYREDILTLDESYDGRYFNIG